MNNFKEQSNSELFSTLKRMEPLHEVTKMNILKEYDKLEKIERDFEKIKTILKERIS